MRDDIKALPIKDGELSQLTHLLGFLNGLKTFTRLFANHPTTLIILAMLVFLAIYLFPLGIAIFIASFISWFRFKKYAKLSPIKGLLNDVKKFNALIQSIHINDQLEEVGNSSLKLKDREKVIEALKLTREDLCRALKTERILRENKKFMSSNSALFENNLIALTTLQVDDQASEQGRLLDEALQIAMSTQEEMRKLQRSDYK